MRVDIPGEAIVLRFRPTEPASVLRAAEREHRRTGLHGVSVFADVPRPGESEQDVIERLLVASELAGLVKEGNPKYYVCAAASQLLELGYTFWKDEDDDETAEHYSVKLGDSPVPADAERFIGLFGQARRR